MNNVLDLKVYRNRRKREHWLKHGHRIEAFVRQFVVNELMVNIHDLIDEYQHLQRQDECDVWAYEDFRTGMLEAIMMRHGADLERQLKSQSWFDSAIFTTEEIAELFLSSMVLGDSAPLARRYR